MYGCMCILGLFKHLYTSPRLNRGLFIMVDKLEKVLVSSGCTDAATCTRSGHSFYKFDFDECQRLQAP